MTFLGSLTTLFDLYTATEIMKLTYSFCRLIV
jgi:hypothetical protein